GLRFPSSTYFMETSTACWSICVRHPSNIRLLATRDYAVRRDGTVQPIEPSVGIILGQPMLPADPALKSGLREVMRQLALELGKVTADHGDVEAMQDRFLGLAIKQELGDRRAPRRPRSVSA